MKYLYKENGKYIFEKSVILNCDIKELFSFHLDTNNLPLISPPFPKVKLKFMSDNPLVVNSKIVVNISFFLFSLNWTILIKEIVEPELVVDCQDKGIFEYWCHSHIFENYKGHVKMIDKVEFLPPYGMLGRLLLPFFFLQLIIMFNYRHKKTKNLFG